MAVKIGDVTIRIGASTTELEKDLRKAERALQATAQKFTAIGQNLTLGVTAPVLAAGAAAFKMASDYEESLNKVRVAFGSSSSSVEEFSKTAIDSIGLAEQSALDMAALFGDMATSMGLTRPAAAEMSTSLVQLAGDLSSFKNINIEEVTTALAGVFTGETESLKRLGIVMTEANVQAYALEKGIKKKLNTMSQAEKVALRYEYVLNATKNAQGDFARTSDGAANQMRVVSQAVKDLGADFGKILLPVITPLIKSIADAVKRFANLDEATKKTVITVAALAAAIGPVLIVYGKLNSLYGSIATGIARVTAQMIANAAATAAANGTVATLTASTVTFGTTLKAAISFLGPYAIAIAAIGAGIYALYKNYESASKESNRLNEINGRAIELIAEEKSKTESLISVLRNENATKERKEGALKKLQEIAPQYFKNLSIEKSSINEINKAYNEYNNSLEKNIRAQLGREDLKQQIIDEEKLRKSIKDRQAEIERLKPITPQKVTLTLTSGGAEQEAQIKRLKALYDDQNAELKQLDSIIKLKDETKKYINTNTDLVESTSNINTNFENATDKTDEYTKKLQSLNKELADNEKLFKAGLITGPEAAVVQLGILQSKLETLVLSGLDPASKAIKDVKDSIKELRSVDTLELLPSTDPDASFGKAIGLLEGELLKGGNAASQATAKILADTAGKIQQYYVGIGEGFVDLTGKFRPYVDEIAKVAVDITQIVNSAISSSLESVGVLIGNLISGDGAGSLKLFFNSILTVVVDFAIGLGKQLIALGTATEALQKLFKTGGGVGAVIAGIGLIAVSTIVKGIIAKGVPSLDIGTDQVKSDGLAMIHKGEAIVPASVVKGGFTGGGGGEIYGRLSGIDLLLSNEYAKSYHKRLR
jgi:hypothetical protein